MTPFETVLDHARAARGLAQEITAEMPDTEVTAVLRRSADATLAAAKVEAATIDDIAAKAVFLEGLCEDEVLFDEAIKAMSKSLAADIRRLNLALPSN